MPLGGLLTAGIVSGGASILGGIFGGSARSKAAKLQEEAYKNAAARTDTTTQNVNNDLINAGNATGQTLRQAAGEGIARNDQAVGVGNQILGDSNAQANLLLDPYRQSGEQANASLQSGLVTGGDFNKTPTLADVQIDPGYAFRAEQATKALQANGAARGGVLGGGSQRDVLALNSNLASQEYQNAFNRFQTSTQNRFNNLNTVAGRGATAANQAGQNDIFTGAQQSKNLIQGGEFGAGLNYHSASDAGKLNFGAAQQAGQDSLQGTRDVNDYLTGGAQARGAGIVGSSNSLWGGIQGAANTGLQTIGVRNLLRNPTGGINPAYANNPLGGGYYGAGPVRP